MLLLSTTFTQLCSFSWHNFLGCSNHMLYCRKKNQPLRLFMQYGPYAAVLELVLLLVVVVTMNASIRHGNQQIAGLKQRIETQQSENRNLLVSCGVCVVIEIFDA